jgi:hypothetical protein
MLLALPLLPLVLLVPLALLLLPPLLVPAPCTGRSSAAPAAAGGLWPSS